MKVVHVHPEDLIDAERVRLLTPEERRRLDAHREECSACAFEHAAHLDFKSLRLPSGENDAAIASAIASARENRTFSRKLSAAAALLLTLIFGTGALAAVHFFTQQEPAPPSLPLESSPRVTSSPIKIENRRVVSAPAMPAPPETLVHAPERRTERETAPPLNDEPSVPLERITASELLRRGNLERSRAEFSQAAATYEELLREHPETREAETALMAWARVELSSRHDSSRALSLFDRYLAEHPSGTLHVEARVGRAQALKNLDRGEEELRAWREIVERFPDSIHATYARGRIAELESP